MKRTQASRVIGRFFGSLLFRSKRGKIAHREVSIISRRPEDAKRLLEKLFGTERAGVRVLLPEDRPVPETGNGGAAAKASEERTGAWYLPRGGRKKIRTRRFHLPLWQQGQKDEENGTWKRLSDVFIVCWPYRDLLREEGIFREICLSLFGAVGEAVDKGRLKKVAFVITGVPDRTGPHHPSQVRLDVPEQMQFQKSLLHMLDRSDRVPGIPLADPLWRPFLRDTVARDKNLWRLLETMRRAVGKNSPIFFTAESGTGASDLEPLLAWVEGEGRRGIERRGSAPGKVSIAAAVLLLIAAVLGFQMPSRDNSVPDGLGPKKIKKELDDRLKAFGKALGFTGFILGSAGAETRNEVARASCAIEPSVKCGVLTASVRKHLEKCDPFNRELRLAAAVAVGGEVTGHYRAAEAWSRSAQKLGIDSVCAGKWKNSIAMCAYGSDLLTYYSVETGPRINVEKDSLPAYAAVVDTVINRYGDPVIAGCLDELESCNSLKAFYELLAGTGCGAGIVGTEDSLTDSLNLIAVSIVKVTDVIDRIYGLKERALILHKQECLDEMEGISRLESITGGRVTLNDDAAFERAQKLKAQLVDYFDPRGISILIKNLSNPNDCNWHADVGKVGLNFIRASSWNNESRGTVVFIPSVVPGDSLIIGINNESETHYGGNHHFCMEPGYRKVIRLIAAAVICKIGSDDFEITIQSAWPIWPPDEQESD